MIAVHKYILTSRSEYFKNLFNRKSQPGELDDNCVITVDNVHYDLFIQLLNFVYTDTCDILTKGNKLDFNFKTDQRTNHNESNCHNASSVSSDPETVVDTEKVLNKSAFSVHQNEKKKRSKKNRKKSTDQHGNSKQENVSSSHNPIKVLQDMAKTFGVKYLVKKLEAVKLTGKMVKYYHRKSEFDEMKVNKI